MTRMTESMHRTFARLLRLGPSLAYALAAVFLLSMVLLGAHPASPFAWSLYMTLLPIMREPIYLLLALPGVGLWAGVALLAAAALYGVWLAMSPRLIRTRFVYSHVALLGLILAMGRAAIAQADSIGIFFPRLINGDWQFEPIAFPMLGLVLFVVVVIGCVAAHFDMVRRARRMPPRSA